MFPQIAVDDSSAYLWHGGELTRYDLESGDILWDVSTGGYLARSANGHVVLATEPETLIARAASDGHVEWAVTLPAMQYPPFVVDNHTTFFVGVG